MTIKLWYPIHYVAKKLNVKPTAIVFLISRGLVATCTMKHDATGHMLEHVLPGQVEHVLDCMECQNIKEIEERDRQERRIAEIESAKDPPGAIEWNGYVLPDKDAVRRIEDMQNRKRQQMDVYLKDRLGKSAKPISFTCEGIQDELNEVPRCDFPLEYYREHWEDLSRKHRKELYAVIFRWKTYLCSKRPSLKYLEKLEDIPE